MGFWERAQADPDWIAVIEPDGTEHAAGDLHGRVNQIVHALRARGLRAGDGIAALVPNGIAPQELSLAALQAGWYYTPINWHFTTPEIAYIVADTGAKAFFVHERFAAGRRGRGRRGRGAGGRPVQLRRGARVHAGSSAAGRPAGQPAAGPHCRRGHALHLRHDRTPEGRPAGADRARS